MSTSTIHMWFCLKLLANAALFASFATAQISVSPSTITYKTELYTTSSAKFVTVTNTGATAINFGAATISGTDAGDYATGTDMCSNHTIAPLKKCRIGVTFSPIQTIGTTETASLSVNDNLGNSLATVPLSGLVTRGVVRVSLASLTATIINPTTSQYQMDFSVSGPYSVDQSQTTCVDIVFQQSKCTIVLVLNGPPAPGSLDILMVPNGGGGKSYKFNLPID